MANPQDENQQAFLLTLSDTLRAHTGVEAVGNRATQLIAQQLGADRVYLVSLDPDNDTVVVTHETRRQDMPPLRGTYRSSDFPAAIKEIFERTIVYSDVRTDARLTELDRLSFAGLNAVGFMAASIRRGDQTMIWAAGALTTQPRSWTASEVVLFEDAVERTWAAIERAKAEEALSKSEERYRTLFETMGEGFALCGVIRDVTGQVVDLSYLTLNRALELQTGLDRQLLIGRNFSEVFPKQDLDRFLPVYARAANSDEPVFFEQYAELIDRWFAISVYHNQPDELSIFYRDITDRKRTEANLAFLAEVSQDLALLMDIDQTMNTLGQKIAMYLGLSASSFAELYEEPNPGTLTAVISHGWYRDDVPSHLGTYRMEEFMTPEVMQLCLAGKAVVIRDVFEDPRTNGEQYAGLRIGSFISMPLVRDGKWRFLLVLYRSEAHDWSQEEIELTRELTTRIWTRLERARAEAALHASQKRFESIANLVPDLLWDSQPDGSTNWYNQRWLDYTGQRFEEAIGWGWVDAIHPDDREASDKRYGFAVEAGKSLQQEHRIRRHDGAYRWFVVSTTPVQDEHGDVIKMYGAATDIHDRKQAEERTRTVLESLPMIVSPTRPDGVAEYVNKEWTVFSGRPAEEFISGEWVGTIHPDDRERVMSTWTAALASGQPYKYELRALAKGGRYRWLLAQGLPLTDSGGTIIRWINTALDIHDQKEAEGALREADRRKDEFLAMLAHELRNPMSTLRSGLGILDLTSTEELTRTTVEMMNRQTDHLVRMVDDLLDVSRITQGKIELRKERVNLVSLVQQAVASSQPMFDQQGKRLDVTLPPIPIYVEGDATRLTQVVTNLLTNGARYTGEQGQVWLSLSHHQHQAILQVRDNGIGLAVDQLSSIFELFMQVDNSTARSKGGLGLGLTLVKRLVELHGGQVDAHSEGLGRGSTFTVQLPTLPVVVEPSVRSAPQAIDSPTSRRILVIDDNEDAAFTLAMLLKLKGYEVHTRHSGRSGLEAADALQPAAILLDIGMPELDGYETCRLLRLQAWGQDVVVIALTGYGQQEDRQRTRESGFDGHLVKPVDLGELTSLLTTLLDKD